MKVAQELEESSVPRQIRFADASKHAQVRLEQGEQALCPVLMHVTPRVFLLRMIDILVDVALQGAVAAGGVRVQPASCLESEVGSLLHRLDGKVPCRLDDDPSLAADPGDDRGPVFVIMAPTGLALLTAPTRSTPQRLLTTALRLPL